MHRFATNLLTATLFTTLSFAAAPAFAHDEVVSVAPAEGSSVTRGFNEVAVTFGEDIMKTPDNAGLMISITHSGGDTDSYQPACIFVDGNKLSVIADLETPGLQVVNWRSVSADGHATEGSFSFTVEENGSHSWGGRVPPADCKVINDLVVIAPAPSESATPAPSADSQLDIGAIVGFVVILFAGVGSVLIYNRIGRKQRSATKG